MNPRTFWLVKPRKKKLSIAYTTLATTSITDNACKQVPYKLNMLDKFFRWDVNRQRRKGRTICFDNSRISIIESIQNFAQDYWNLLVEVCITRSC